MDVANRPVQKVDIHLLTDLVAVEGAVAVGNYVALGVLLREGGVGEEGSEIGFFLVDSPHLEEHETEGPCGVALHHHGGVLPVPEGRLAVYVPVGEVDSAGEGGVPVDDENFPVVAVVIVGRNEGRKGREHLAFYSEGVEALRVVVGEVYELVGSVVHHPNVDPLLRLAGENFQDPSPHFALVDDEIFGENEVLSLFELLEHLLEHILAHGVVGDVRVFVNGETAAPFDILRKGGCAGSLLPEFFEHGFVLLDFVPGLLGDLPEALLESPVPDFELGV